MLNGPNSIYLRFLRKLTGSRILVILQSGDITFGMTRATVDPVCTIFRSLSNIMWNGNTLQNVAGLTFGSKRLLLALEITEI